MELMLNEGEQVYYSRDYSKGRKKSTGNVTVTDERIINAVESKYGTRKTEIALSEVGGVKTRFKPTNVAAFVVTGILAILSIVYSIVLKPGFGGSAPSGNSAMETTRIVAVAITAGCAVISFVCGLFSLRNGFYIVVGTTSSACFKLVEASDYLGGLKPLILKTKKDVAFQMMGEISAALLDAKAKSKSKQN